MQPSTVMPLPPMPIELQVISSALHENKVYVTGSADVKYNMSFQVLVYSIDKAEWSTLPRAPNYNSRATVMNGRITLIGGRDAETKKITDVQSTWFEEESQWKQMRMDLKRLESGNCYHDNLLLVTGGVIDSAEKGKASTTVVKTVNVCNVSTRLWSTPKALELPKAVRSHHVVVFGENIYVIGGAFRHPTEPKYGDKQLNPDAWRARWSDIRKAIEQPSEESVWTPITAPPVLRPTVVAYRNSLMCIGGVKDNMPQKEVYRFVDGKNDNHWIKVGNMKVGRYRHGVVAGVVESPHVALFVVGGYVLSDPEGDETAEKSSSVEMVIL